MNLKKRSLRKLKKSGGFTLIEMLIVVAIIAILVVISIPIVGSALDKAKTATDDANERAAKAAALITYMTAETTPTGKTKYYYDAASGKAIEKTAAETAGTTITAYGQGSKDSADQPRNGYVVVTIDTEGNTSVAWSGSTPTAGEDETGSGSTP